MAGTRANGKVRGVRCGWVRPSRHHSEAKQIEQLEQHDVHPIYTSASHTVADVARSLLPGNEVWVTSLGRLAIHRRELRPAMQMIRDKGAVIVEAGTGRRSDRANDAADMVSDAVDELASDARGLPTRLAKKYGARGGKAKAEAVATSRLSTDNAERWWFDGRLTTEQALEKMPGWSMVTAYRRLGKRKRPAGRPREKI